MLDFLRRSATSVLAWIILGLLALVFGLSFGLPSDGLVFGPKSLVTVRGEPIRDAEFRYQANLLSERLRSVPGIENWTLDAAVERHVVGGLARGLGIVATQQDAEDLVLKGQFIAFGETGYWLGPDTPFNYELFTRSFLRSLQIAENKYYESQALELQARTLRDLVLAATVVPEAEIRAAYDRTANTVSLRYARFDPRDYSGLVDPTEADITRHVESHEAELTARFDAQGSRFTKLSKQARVRLLRIETNQPSAATSKAAARKLVAKARARVLAGEDFRKVARELSDHPTARSGGDYGWAGTEGTGTGLPAEIDRAIEGLEPGALSEVIETDDALYLVRVEGRRFGDVPKAEALRELAEEELTVSKGRDLARAAAKEALHALQAGTPFAERFAAEPNEGSESAGIENLTPKTAGSTGSGTPKATIATPAARTTGPFRAGDPIPGLGTAPALAKAAFEGDPARPVLEELFEVEDTFVVAAIEAKKVGTDDDYAKERTKHLERLMAQKGEATLAAFVRRACYVAKGEGKLVTHDTEVAKILGSNERTQGTTIGPEAAPKGYQACDRVAQPPMRFPGFFGGPDAAGLGDLGELGGPG